jgi:H+/Cl- antiporter ClcA
MIPPVMPVLAASGGGTSSTLLVGVIVGVFCGFFCVMASARSQRRTGRRLWRMSPWLWFLIGLIGGVLGLLPGPHRHVHRAVRTDD